LIIHASAPAKIIIVGEHFVVEGEPAIAAAINLRAHAYLEPISSDYIEVISSQAGYQVKFSLRNFEIIEGENRALKFLEPIRALIKHIMTDNRISKGFRLRIASKIPIAVGLGSSASVLVACAAAILRLTTKKIDKNLVIKYASKAEEVAHARPSGIDPTIATHGGVLIYRRGEGFIRLSLPINFRLVIGVTSIARSTGEMVEKVRNLKSRYPSVFEPLYHAAGHLAIEAARAIESGNLTALGELMNINHGMLSSIGVSNFELEKLVYAARSAGAFGAKITGAGGGGSIIALVDEKRTRQVATAIRRAGGKPLIARISGRGVMVSGASP